MADYFEQHAVGLTSPAGHCETITPSVDPLQRVTRGIYIGTSGNLVATSASGEAVTFTGLVAGMIYPLRLTHVLPASTCGAMVGLS